MAPHNKPVAEVEVDVQLVRRLLRDQHPDLADLTITECSSGWDNFIFRLGESYSVRMPRRAAAAQLVLNEQMWLPVLGPNLPVPVPVPVRSGKPALGYPWSWSVCRWFEGEVLGDHRIADPRAWVRGLGDFLTALHVASPPDAPHNAIRGCPLSDRADNFDRLLGEIAAEVDASSVASAWLYLHTRPVWPGPAVWLHGDLHPLNIVTDSSGDLSAIIDFGDITGGDPSTDLAIGWMIFDVEHRALFRDATMVDGDGIDDDTWMRAKAWALYFAVAYLANSADVPVLNRIGRATLANVLSDID